MKVSVVLGTRPEVIKLAPVIREARKRGHRVTVVLTGQHREIARRLLDFFEIKADIDLDVMTPGQTLTSLSARILSQLDQHPELLKSDVMVVQGDTTSAWIAAYWAFCNRIPVAHVEAGLRTYDLTSPFPEEANRQLIGRLATFHFTPTKMARQALLREQTPTRSIHVVGNTAIDALHFALKKVESKGGRGIPEQERLPASVESFVGDHPMVLVTAHRRESFGRAFEDMCAGIRMVADRHPDVRIVYPVHPNPNVRKPVQEHLAGHPGILLCEPLPYAAFVSLMKKAKVLLTDSGGIQEEGPTLKKPILVMRDKTERPEGVKAGFSKLIGTDAKKILKETGKALTQPKRPPGKNPYGDGKTSERIVLRLEGYFRSKRKS